MCSTEEHPARVFWTPSPISITRRKHPPAMPMSERRTASSRDKPKLFHVAHKVPSGDSPYVRAKHVQLISKDPSRAISLFWAAINAGDRVDSALKDMAVIMKQLNRSDEGIEAIKSFRCLCPIESQDSIDNLLLELYKKSGRIEEEAELLESKLKTLEAAEARGKMITKMKRSQGKQVSVTLEQEKARLLGNLAWVHLQLHNYGIAEQHYRKALGLDPDKNKKCNLAICLMQMNRINEAKYLLEEVRSCLGNQWKTEPFSKSFERAIEKLAEIESRTDITAEDSFCGHVLSRDLYCEGKKENRAPLSPASIRQNSAGLFTQPRGCRWDREDREGSYRENGGSARRLSFDKCLINGLHEYIKESEDCEMVKAKRKKNWADMVEEEEEEG